MPLMNRFLFATGLATAAVALPRLGRACPPGSTICESVGAGELCCPKDAHQNVVTAPNVVIIYWGWSSDSHANKPALESYFREIGSTRWMDVLWRYHYVSSPGAFPISINTTSLPNRQNFTVSAPQFLNPCEKLRNYPMPANRSLPWPNNTESYEDEKNLVDTVAGCGFGDESTIYALALPEGISGYLASHPEDGDALQPCAAHAGFINKDGHARHFLELPYATSGDTICGHGTVESVVTSNAHHELTEAITDALPQEGNFGWLVHASGGLSEIADVCVGTWDNIPMSVPPYSMWIEGIYDVFAPGGGRCATAYSPGFITYVRGTDDQLYEFISTDNYVARGRPPNGQPLGSAPSAIAGQANATHVFVTDAQSTIWERWSDTTNGNSGWQSWSSIPFGYVPVSRPASTAPRTFRYDVVVAGVAAYPLRLPAAVFWATRSDTPVHGGQPSSWTSLGAPSGLQLRSAPTIASFNPNREDVFVLASDGNIWTSFTNTGDWSDHAGWYPGWGHPANRTLTGDPSVASWGNGRLDLFVTDTQGNVWHRYWDNGFFSDWAASDTPLGQFVDPGVEAAAMGTGRILMTVRMNGVPYRSLYDGAWQTWYREGGVTRSSVGTAASW